MYVVSLRNFQYLKHSVAKFHRNTWSRTRNNQYERRIFSILLKIVQNNTSGTCFFIVFQRDLDFNISVKFEGELSEVKEETDYKMR